MLAPETLPEVSEAAQALSSGYLGGVSVRLILRQAAHAAGVDFQEMISAKRSTAVSKTRQRAWWLCRVLLPDASFPRIGRQTGGRDHTTIIAGVSAVERRLKSNTVEDERMAISAILSAVKRAAPRVWLTEDIEVLQTRLAALALEFAALEQRLNLIRNLETGHG